MKEIFEMLEFNKIIEQLKELTLTETARNRFDQMSPVMNQTRLERLTADTTEAKICLDRLGTPPLSNVTHIRTIVDCAVKGVLLTIEELEQVRQFLTTCRRLSSYLQRIEEPLRIAEYGKGIVDLEFLKEEIERCIRNGQVDDYASKELRDTRRKLESITLQIRQKLDSLLKSKKEYFSESFVSNRNGHFTLPVKKEYKHQISGSVIDTSATKSTYFIEPTAVSKLRSEYEGYKIEETNEERKILYLLTSFVADCSSNILLNVDYIEELDFIFAKGKLSVTMQGVPATITNDRSISLKNARHPLLAKEKCVPLSLEFGNELRGIVITGPNTGGKTVALKVVGLLSIMAQSGLHIPCEAAKICMNSQVLCDVGDGQNISENLSTFSAHIKNVIEIVNKVDSDTLVLMDELGSGTDPQEGMGIAIAILEELKKSNCLFIATTHYPEVKNYAEVEEGLCNARMAFDKDTLKPLYQLEMGEAGKSCALYIAKQLGLSSSMLHRAYQEAYLKNHSRILVGKNDNHMESQSDAIPSNILKEDFDAKEISQNRAEPASEEKHLLLIRKEEKKEVNHRANHFEIGDSVMVYPQKKLGIVFRKADSKGEIGVQIQKQKYIINHKRLKRKASAKDLYPEDYDFSILFDTVENRKARKKMEKRHMPGLEIKES